MAAMSPIERRRFLQLIATAPFAFAIASRLGGISEAEAAEALFAASAPGGSGRVPATPDCADADEPTPPTTAGPFFTPHSPQRSSLREPGLHGTPLAVSGFVVTRGCRPVPGALIDVWHADADGEYDNRGYRCRGHLFADANGAYRFESIVPGLYPGRTRHVHVRVQPKGGRILTTQLFFPGEPRNASDGIFRPELLMAMNGAPGASADERRGRFNFVLEPSG
jgi:protocatechuate 3,4-dioxygenase beta subunit